MDPGKDWEWDGEEILDVPKKSFTWSCMIIFIPPVIKQLKNHHMQETKMFFFSLKFRVTSSSEDQNKQI